MPTIPEGGQFDIDIIQGSRYARTFYAREANGTTVIPLTGHTARAQVRAYAGAPGNPLLTFTATVNPAAGSVTISASASQTAALTQQGEYDVELVPADPEQAFTLVRGRVNLVPQVTLP